MTEKNRDPWDDLEGPSTRKPRSLETRENTARKRVWQEPSILPDPDPQDGYKFRWVRVSNRGEADEANAQKRGREGWEKVSAEDHPELVANLGQEQVQGFVQVGSLILCKIPEEIVEQRTKYYSDRTAAIEKSAEESYMRDSSEVVRKVNENKRRQLFGR